MQTELVEPKTLSRGLVLLMLPVERSILVFEISQSLEVCITLIGCILDVFFKFYVLQVSDKGLKALAEGNCSDTLSELIVNSCLRISDNGLVPLFKSKQLKILVCHGCPNVSGKLTSLPLS